MRLVKNKHVSFNASGKYVEHRVERKGTKDKRGRIEKYNHHRYYTDRWKRIRLSHLSKQPLCLRCLSQGVYVPAHHVDHVQPHKGDGRVFWDTANLQSLCASCHSWKTYRERQGYTDDFREYAYIYDNLK